MNSDFGNAFPTPDSAVERSGMTLRDYMAGQALVGMLSKYGNDGKGRCAELSYEIADAMLKARDES